MTRFAARALSTPSPTPAGARPRVRPWQRLGGIVGALALALSSTLNVAAAPAGQPDSFIVVLKDGVDSRVVASEHAARHQAGVRFIYEHALHGYAARLSSGAVGVIAADGRVAYVERDAPVSINTTQSGATWGLDRIDQRQPHVSASASYTYTATGAGVAAYIIDTGINLTHDEFGGRATGGFDAVTNGGTAIDCNGHGTHVAGTVGGTTYGVAKGVSLVAVRVLDCAGSGTWSGVIAGIDWVTANHTKNLTTTPTAKAVANMSLGGGASSAVDTAVRNMIVSGVATAVAAGNGNQGGVAQDACKSSPARVAEAMTIGATDKADAKTSWSNYGRCVDWFAPGSGITSAWTGSANATNTISGTSMASPHTAGVAALFLQTYSQTNPASTPADVRTALYANTTQGVVKSSKTTNNHLLFTSY